MIYFFVQQCRQTLNISLCLSLTDEQVQNVAKNLLSLFLSLSLSLNVHVKTFKLAFFFFTTAQQMGCNLFVFSWKQGEPEK